MMKRAIVLCMWLGIVNLCAAADVVLGAERTERYFPLLEGKRVALLSNDTGVAGGVHGL